MLPEKKVCVFLLFLLLTVLVSELLVFGSCAHRLARGVETVGPEWSVADVGFGTKPSFDFDTQDRVHVMTMTESFDGGVWHGVAGNGEGPWDLVQVAAGYFYGPGDLRVDARDTAHLAWLDIDPDETTRGWVQYGVLDNGVWSIEMVDTLDQDGLPHIAYGDRQVVKYSTRSGGAWQTSALLESTDDRYNGLVVLRLDSHDEPGIVFWQDHVGQAGLVRFLAPLGTTPGDMDGDGIVDFNDIDPFVLGLTDSAAYAAMFGVPPEFRGDLDGDGGFDFDDIDISHLRTESGTL